MRTKKCAKCGKAFETDRYDQTQCTECLAAARATTIRPRICRQCGAAFDGGPRAWYCPSCRAAQGKESAAKYRKTGASRQLGSTDLCKVCGKEYVVAGGRQKYCPECAEEVVKAIDREASREWNRANDYHASAGTTQDSALRSALCAERNLCQNVRPSPARRNAHESDVKKSSERPLRNMPHQNARGRRKRAPAK